MSSKKPSNKPVEGFTLLEAAKVLGISRCQLIRLLKTNGYLGPNNLPFREHIRSGLMRIKTEQYTLPGWNIRRYSTSAQITGKGMTAINWLLNDGREETPAICRRDSSAARPGKAQPSPAKSAGAPARAGGNAR